MYIYIYVYIKYLERGGCYHSERPHCKPPLLEQLPRDSTREPPQAVRHLAQASEIGRVAVQSAVGGGTWLFGHCWVREGDGATSGVSLSLLLSKYLGGRRDLAQLLPPQRPAHRPHFCLTQSVYKVALQKSIPTRIRLLVLYIGNSKGSVDEFVSELTFAKRLFGKIV